MDNLCIELCGAVHSTKSLGIPGERESERKRDWERGMAYAEKMKIEREDKREKDNLIFV